MWKGTPLLDRSNSIKSLPCLIPQPIEFRTWAWSAGKASFEQGSSLAKMWKGTSFWTLDRIAPQLYELKIFHGTRLFHQGLRLTATTKAEKKRIAAAGYYERNADRIREKRRIQMAEKRAEKKAKRRKADKSKPRKNLKRANVETEPPVDDACSPSALQHVERDLQNTEREVSETLAGMRLTRLKTGDSPLENWAHMSPQSDEDDEQRMRIRTISEVAGHQLSEIGSNRDLTPPACNAPIYSNPSRKLNPSTPWFSPTPRSPVVDVDHSRRMGRPAQKAKLPTPSSSPTPTFDPLVRMPNVLDYLDAYMGRKKTQ
ncbi:hypothetical protein B0H14DRAFT_2631860 [Mycena olivaceomarginata]|nr:hypothetical protein B0H14DRAFT_2631860 [Mycena olivaceomarginata]